MPGPSGRISGAIAATGAVLFALVLLASAFATPALAPAGGPPGESSEATIRPSHTAIPVATEEPAPRRVPPQLAYGRFIVPIAGASLPTDPIFYPESRRDYRAGIHEGLDFPAPTGTEVRAAADGTIVRIDRTFVEWSAEERDRAFADAIVLGYTSAALLDRVRGRQVWIDHGAGVVTRYAHLSAVAELAAGSAIAAGAVVGAVGSSGFPEGGPHLHFEIRLGDGYLGDGLPPAAVVALYARAFR